MKKVIVTGAGGYLGYNLCRLLNENAVIVYAVFRSDNNHTEELAKLEYVKPIRCDLANADELLILLGGVQIDAVFHLAWAGVSGINRGEYAIQLKNVENTLHLIEIVKKLDCRRFIGFGTTAEYDAYNASVDDGVCPNIVSMYGTTKMTAHFLSKTLCNSLGIEHIWGIIGNTYGEGDNSTNFVNFAIGKIMSEDDAEFTSGEQNYDFVYYMDVVEAIYCLGENGKDKHSYYIGSGSPRKLKEYIQIIRDTFNPTKKLLLGAVPFNGISASMQSFNIDKTRNDTGYIPKVPFEEGIKRVKRCYEAKE